MKRALFIFRRDLRLEDNCGLNLALQKAEEVILSFIFTPEQIEKNPYRGDSCLQFMIESLEDLQQEIQKEGGKLYLFFGQPEVIVDKLNVDGVFVNRDYTPYSIERDKKIEKVCKRKEIPFFSAEDLLLHPIDETLKSDGKPYTVFTPFYRNALKLEVKMPQKMSKGRFFSGKIDFADSEKIYEKILPLRRKQELGGRKSALKILKSIETFSNYGTVRDFPSVDGTTHLSPHLKFTTCSIREAYHSLASNPELIRSIHWREFFTLIGYHFPEVFKGSFKPQFNNLQWIDDQKGFKIWSEGNTGFPIVDAGMRELNQTGFMHNRVRMIAASFLVKDLHINWQVGERYFANRLIDYDPAVNNGNWQWVAGTGCDAQPFFRIFNPWSQAKKFDPEAIYIKKWIPELSALSPDEIHSWHLAKKISQNYPKPILDHSEEAGLALNYYKLSRNS